MVAYYVVQNVKAGAPTSWKPGRTLIPKGYKTETRALDEASVYNHHNGVREVFYDVVACEEMAGDVLAETKCDQISRI